ncbi:MAG: hypothetical protein V3R30_02510 [Kiloniellales bacterium]
MPAAYGPAQQIARYRNASGRDIFYGGADHACDVPQDAATKHSHDDGKGEPDHDSLTDAQQPQPHDHKPRHEICPDNLGEGELA